MRAPLVDGHGNFGSIDGDSAAAMRYTEVRMAPLALELLRDIEKDTVPFRLNFDDTLKEPDLLPGRFPNLLVNGAMGIAVGLATNIPTHNLQEVVRAVVAQIDNPDITLDELMTLLPGPDFPTGGLIVGKEGIRQAYETGRGRITIRSKCRVEEATGGRSLIVIDEVPYGVNKASMLEKILRLSEERKEVLSAIGDIRDESDRNGLRAVIEIKKGGDAQKILQYLYKYSDLQVNFGINMVAIADGKPRQLGLKAINSYYIQHQKNVVTNRTRYDLEQAEAREHILEGLLIAISNIDEVIRIIRASKSTPEAKRNLMAGFDLTGIQAQAILDMRLQRLTALEVDKLTRELGEVRQRIAAYRAILKSPKKLMAVIKGELLDIAKRFGDARRTQLMEAEHVEEFNPEDYIVVEDVMLTFTREGYAKRMPERTYNRSNREADLADLGPEDAPLTQFMATTAQKLWVFTQSGLMFQVPVLEIAEGRWRERGGHLSAIVPALTRQERLAAVVVADTLPDNAALLFVTAQGLAKRVAATEFVTRSRKIVGCPLKEGDRLLCVEPARRGSTLVLAAASGNVLATRHTQMPEMGRTAKGVKAMQLGSGEELLLATQMDGADELLLMTDVGYGKRVMAAAFSPQNRGGKGTRCFAPDKKGTAGHGLAAALRLAAEGLTLVVAQKKGDVARFATDTLPVGKPDGKFALTPVLVMNADNAIQSVYTQLV